jgi:TRAP-type C4-dicarboxylate transport system permease small subunit
MILDSKDDSENLAVTDSYRQSLPWGMHYLIKAMNALGTLWIFALVVLLNTDVLGRNFFGKPLLGVPEILSISIVGIVFLQLAECLNSGKLTRSEVLMTRMESWTTGGASFAQALESYEMGEYIGALGTFRSPMWPIKFIVVFGLAITAICLLMLVFKDIKSGLSRRKVTQ